MASTSNAVVTDATFVEGESIDPLTPIERMILNLLLEKQGKAKSSDGDQPTTSDAAMGNAQNGVPAKQTATNAQNGPPKVDADELSDGPLDDEELYRLMHEYGIEEEDMSGSDSDQGGPPLCYPPSGRGRGGARGSRGGRGRGRGRGGRAAAPTNMDDDTDDSEEGDDEFEQDPIMRGTMALEKMSDEQVIQFMEMYKTETSASEVNYDAFMQWVATKVQVAAASPIAPKTKGKKVVLGGPKTRGRGRRGRGQSR